MSCKLSLKEMYYTNRWIVQCSDCIVCMLSFCVDLGERYIGYVGTISVIYLPFGSTES